MTIYTAVALAAISIFIPGGLVRAQDAPTPAQSEPLQGIWEGVEVGREAAGKCRMTITGASMHFEGSNKNEWYKATLALRTDTDPKQLLAKITECSRPAYVGKPSIAIYKIEGGTLTLVGHPPGAPDAPQSFEGDATSRSFVFKKAEIQKQNSESLKPTNPER